jgi:hypothetical protein
MEGLFISKNGQVQAIGNADVLDFIPVLESLMTQLLQMKQEKLLHDLKSVPIEYLANELKSRNDNHISDEH